MLSSARRGISYPNPDRTDAPDVPAHIKNLVDALELDVIFTQASAASRAGATHKSGVLWYETDTGLFYYDDGTNWHLIGANITRNTMAARPTAASSNTNLLFFATDTNGGTLYYSDGTVWTKLANGLTELPADNTIPPAKLTGQTIVDQNSNYTLVLSDRMKVIRMNNAGALTLTVPTNASVAFGIGDSIDVIQWGAGQITITAAGGVTIVGNPGLKSNGQYSMFSLIKTDVNTWLAVGALTT